MSSAMRLSQVAGMLDRTSSRWPPPPSLTDTHPPRPKPLDALPAGSKMTAEKFLNRLPKCVIRQGEVIDIRGPIRDTLKVRPILAPPVVLGASL